MKSLSEGEEDVETGDAPEKPTGLAKSDSSMSTTSNEPSIPRLIRRDASEAPTRLVKTDSIMSTVRDRPVPAIPRMVRRDLPAFQSNNRFVVKHKLTRELWFLLRHDWFHVVLNQPAPLSIFILLIFWTLVILVFAAVYIRIDRASPETFCGLGINNEPFSMASAFAFSLETATTVGYGLPNGTNSFFSNCPGLQTVIYFQMGTCLRAVRVQKLLKHGLTAIGYTHSLYNDVQCFSIRVLLHEPGQVELERYPGPIQQESYYQ